MAKQTLNIGLTPNDGTGDTLRDGGDKIQDNFDELYTALGGDTLRFAVPDPAVTPIADGDVLKYSLANGAFEPQTPTDIDTTYSHSAESSGSDVILRLRQDANGVITNDDITIQAGTGITLNRIDADNFEISNPVGNTTYDISVQSLVAGSQTLRLTGSNATTDDVNFTEGTGISITSSGPNGMTVNADVESVNGSTGAVKTYVMWDITSETANEFVMTGHGLATAGENDPTLFVYRGFTYEISNSTGGSNSVRIQVTGGGAYPSDHISSTGSAPDEAADGEVVTFTIPMNASVGATYQYVDPLNGNKLGSITVV